MLVSIVIPVYNVETYLNQCVMSFIDQMNYLKGNAEIILVDDGSTDSSGRICDQLAKRYPDFVNVLHKNNEGLLLTRRFGYKQAKGKYIINCDADDFAEPEMFSSIEPYMKKDFDVILFNMNSFKNEKKHVLMQNLFGIDTYEGIVSKENCLRELFLSYDASSLCSKIFKKSCLDIEKDYSEYSKLNYGEDTLQSAEIYSNSNRIIYLNKALYNYRIQNGMTFKYREDYYFQFKKVLNGLKEYNDILKIDEFEELFATKLLEIVGRSITQSRYNKKMKISESICYLEKIREDDDVIKYSAFFKKIKYRFRKSYRILLYLFMKKHFVSLAFMLKLKNCMS